MSKVVKQAITRYKKAILIEVCTMAIISGFLFIWQWKSAVDFSLGFLSALLPFCLFIYIVFFRTQSLSKKLTALYRAEALKFISTIIFVTISFKWSVVNFIAFFVGFFIALILNNLVPFLLHKY
ncbi:ATP synthase subunit I [Rodentibacter caecimuris]|uniref:ATP F0F1 synthase subunit I n=1 Tax=Rodentibacter caecimuris TaxID=1796644 RepID=A0ABX3KWM8_9PAST|nr:ATP F0F1 synthase subunit I [Rodentibacter heylii]